MLFGPESAAILRTGDDVEDKSILAAFNRLAAEKTQLQVDETNPNRVTLLVGAIEWPFAVPLTRAGDRWFWDIEEGKAEVRRRTIGGNELDAIDICRGYVEAQRMYAESDWDGNGIFEYASRIVSTEGTKNGLYWPGEDSPVAAPFARAVAEGYKAGATPKPYHGYFYKMLLGQGPQCARRRSGLHGQGTDDRRFRACRVACRVRRFRNYDVYGQSRGSCVREESRSPDQHTRQSNDQV